MSAWARTAAQARYFGENAGLAPNRGRPRNLSRREARVLDAIGKAAGVQIKFADTMNGANASIENGVLTIAKDADDPVRAAFTHEIVHRVRESAPEAYSTLAQFVVDNMSDERLASAIRARSDAYSDMNYSVSNITEEVVSDAFGRMASEPELLEKIAGVDRTAAQKILDAIDELLRKIKAALSGKEQAQLTANQIEAFRDLQGRGEEMAKALRAALDKVQEQAQTANENAAPEDGAARYSLRTFEDGTKYVDVDVDQSIFDGLSVSEMQKAAKNEITKRFKGKVIGTDYTTYVDRNSARHYAYPANRRMDTQQKQNKMRASTELDNIVAASTFRENVPDDGRHPTATGGLDKLDTVFRVNGRTYKAGITVLVTGRGRIFYDLTKFKDITGRETGQTQSVAETSNNVSVNSVTDTAQKSNTQNGDKRESRKSVADAEAREAALLQVSSSAG